MVAEPVSNLRTTSRVALPPRNDENNPPPWPDVCLGVSSDLAVASSLTFTVVMSTPEALAAARSVDASACAEGPTRPTAYGLVDVLKKVGPAISATAPRVVIPVMIQVARPRSRSEISRPAISRIDLRGFNCAPVGGRARPTRRSQGRTARPTPPPSPDVGRPVCPCLGSPRAGLQADLC